ncbi:hypothetical protein OP864_09500 [Saprospira grandis]|nr:hypothetical protein [Saprospira grandis]WBM73233.1 hypothetical protein OP864_09500 [Saprospira grandis]
MFWGSQVCSALRRLCRLGLAYGHPVTALGRLALGPYILANQLNYYNYASIFFFRSFATAL